MDDDLNRIKIKFEGNFKEPSNTEHMKKSRAGSTGKQLSNEHKSLALLGFSWENCGMLYRVLAHF